MHSISTETLEAILNELQHRPYGSVYKLMDTVIEVMNTPATTQPTIIGA